MNKKFIIWIFFCLVCLSLFSPLWVFRDLLFPYVTSKAFFFRIAIELALPFYLYLLIAQPELRPNLKKNPLNWLMLIFLAFNLLSALVGDNATRALWGNFERMGGVYYLAHLTLLYFYIIMLGQMGGRYLKWFLQTVLLVALVVTVNGIFGKLGLPMLVQDPSLPNRVSSTLGNPIYLGSFLVVPLFLAMFLGSQTESKFWKWAYYFSSLLFLIGILLSGTRGALVGLVVGGFLAAVVYLFLSENKKIRIYGLVSVAVFVVACALLFFNSGKLPQGSDVQRLFKLKDSNTAARLLQWKVALRGYKDHPIFGVGPENYYVIANKYYDPAIAQYDRSWFDKPHNYLLEILVTSGIFGLLTYLALIVFIIIALYKGFKTGFLTLFEFSVLLAALLVYQIQNLTVFDTVPASLTFYSFVGLSGFIAGVAATGPKKAQKKNYVPPAEAFPLAVFGVSLVVMAYALYATNIVPLRISKNVNYGYAYAAADPSKAEDFFQTAVSLPFNFDKTETADKYADFAVSLARNANASQQGLSQKVSAESEAELNQALAVQPDYPILWQNLAQVYLFQNFKNGTFTSVDPRAMDALQKAVDLAPNRTEAYSLMAEVLSLEGKNTKAENIFKDLIKKFPFNNDLKSQLANVYRVEGRVPEAVALISEAINNGYTFSSYSDMQWLVSYYYNQKQYDKALTLLLQAVKIDPNNLDAFSDLAKVYALLGQKDKAIAIAEQVMKADPSRAKEMQALIDSLK